LNAGWLPSTQVAKHSLILIVTNRQESLPL